MSGQGKGLHSGRRHQRALSLRDNISKISRGSIQRLARRAGVKRLSGVVYDETRGVLRVFLENVVGKAIVYTEHA
jgi:histone H4